jgi:uncharacterized membrane protein
MTLTIVAAFVTGFFAGNGLPYYFAGSTGEPRNPSPFADSTTVNVVVGCVALLIAAASACCAGWRAHPLASAAGAWSGVLVVGLIHAHNWRSNPWRKRQPRARESA